MPPEQNNAGKSGLGQVLQTLAGSGDRAVQLGTLFMVLIGGLGNYVATEKSGSDTRSQFQREIHEVYTALDRNKEKFRELSKDASEARDLIAGEVRSNQRQLENQSEILKILREGQNQFLQRQQRLFPQEP